ncbi:MAG: cation-transporting P-type ATPase, partial [Flavisolibacter sp.]
MDQVYQETKSSPQGLTAIASEERLKQVGLNELEEGKKKSVAGIV